MIEGSRKLIEGVDENGDFALYVIVGKPGDGYELYRCRLDHVSHHTRSWQAVKEARGVE